MGYTRTFFPLGAQLVWSLKFIKVIESYFLLSLSHTWPSIYIPDDTGMNVHLSPIIFFYEVKAMFEEMMIISIHLECESTISLCCSCKVTWFSGHLCRCIGAFGDIFQFRWHTFQHLTFFMTYNKACLPHIAPAKVFISIPRWPSWICSMFVLSLTITQTYSNWNTVDL